MRDCFKFDRDTMYCTCRILWIERVPFEVRKLWSTHGKNEVKHINSYCVGVKCFIYHDTKTEMPICARVPGKIYFFEDKPEDTGFLKWIHADQQEFQDRYQDFVGDDKYTVCNVETGEIVELDKTPRADMNSFKYDFKKQYGHYP